MPLKSLAQAQAPPRLAATEAARRWRALLCLHSLDGTYGNQQATCELRVDKNTHMETLAPQLLTLGTLLVARLDGANKRKL